MVYNGAFRMLSSVLFSKMAIRVNIAITRALVLSENIVETISELRKKDGKDIWLVGGGQLISILLGADMIDEMQITYIPAVLGNGIPLFPNNPKESQWSLLENKAFDNGVLQVKYQRK